MNDLEVSYLERAKECIKLLKCYPEDCKISFPIKIIEGRTAIEEPRIYFSTDYGLSEKDIVIIKDLGLEILEMQKVRWPNVSITLGYTKSPCILKEEENSCSAPS